MTPPIELKQDEVYSVVYNVRSYYYTHALPTVLCVAVNNM